MLVCGGLGGIGLVTCRWLAECGTNNIVLTSRSGLVKDTHTQDQLDMIMQYPVRIAAYACNASDLTQVRALSSKNSFTGIVQSTLVTAGGFIHGLDVNHMLSAWAPKIEGAKHMHALSQPSPECWFLAYSSVAAVMGPAGDSSYATSNAALDAFATWRHGNGNLALSVQSGLWQGVGSGERYGKIIAKRFGIENLEGMSSSSGLCALQTICSSGVPRMMAVTGASLEPLLQTNPMHGLQHLLRGPVSDDLCISENSIEKAIEVPTNDTGTIKIQLSFF